MTSSLFWMAKSAVVLGFVAGAMFLTYKEFYLKGNSKDEKDNTSESTSTGTKNKANDKSKESSDVDALILERFESCVQHMKKEIGQIPQSSQLEFYALYKQATLGEVDDFFGPPGSGKEPLPASYNLVAKAKYDAWKKVSGMSRNAAMQQYIDKAVHYEFTRSIMIVGDENGVDNENDSLEGDDDGVMNFSGMGLRQSTLAGDDGAESTRNMNESSKNITHPLHEAARNNDVAKLKKLLKEAIHGPDEKDEAGQTALHLAADAGHPACIQVLVKHGANVHAADNDGISVLQAAVIGGDVETCRLLCVLGANPDQEDRDGDTPRNCSQDDPVLRELLFQASMGQLNVDPATLLNYNEDDGDNS